MLRIDKPSHIISNEVDSSVWNPLRVGMQGPNVSHLMFGDDLLLFGKATDNQVICMLDTLRRWGDMSGQEASVEKMTVLFSRGVANNTGRSIVAYTSFREVSCLSKYLGVPLLGRSHRVSNFNYVIDPVNNKLASWKANQLCFVG